MSTEEAKIYLRDIFQRNLFQGSIESANVQLVSHFTRCLSDIKMMRKELLETNKIQNNSTVEKRHILKIEPVEGAQKTKREPKSIPQASILARLKLLQELFNAGVIDKAKFANRKKGILDRRFGQAATYVENVKVSSSIENIVKLNVPGSSTLGYLRLRV